MPTTLRKGLLKRVHVNMNAIRSNKKHGTNLPPISIKVSGGNVAAHEIEIKGPSKLVYSPDKPLACGARMWIETRAEIDAR